MKKTIVKIGNQKSNLEDLPSTLREKIEEQVNKIENKNKIENTIENRHGDKSIFRKMFGSKSGILERK